MNLGSQVVQDCSDAESEEAIDHGRKNKHVLIVEGTHGTGQQGSLGSVKSVSEASMTVVKATSVGSGECLRLDVVGSENNVECQDMEGVMETRSEGGKANDIKHMEKNKLCHSVIRRLGGEASKD